jgi:molybdopterin-guanine dinucleotide biosynthesis protein A
MLSVAVQAGGESSRMGRDKGLVPFLGQALIVRVIERVKALADEILVTTNQPEDYRFLGLPLFEDLVPDRGALGGLYTALSAAQYANVAVVACDMPFVNPDLLASAQNKLLEQSVDAVLPETEHGMEPFHAVYRREPCLRAVEAALQAGKWRLISWLSDVRVARISGEEILRYDPQQLAFLNVNTPEDLHQAEQLANKS